MSGSGRHFARATRLLRKLRGGSQPALVEASDGNLYVLKFLDNLQGSQLLFNESIGTELYRSCKLATAPWTPLVVSSEFLDQNPSCWTETPEGRRRPSAGVCFGSRFQDMGNGWLFEILPGGYFSRIANLERFWLAWFLDACCGHSDNRQAIFKEAPTGELELIFIDFGHMFFGPNGNFHPKIATSRYLDGRIYPRMTKQLMMTLRRIADDMNSDELWHLVSEIPDEWKSAIAIRNLTTCLGRLSDSQFVNMTLETMAEAHRQKECDLSFSRVHDNRVSVLRANAQVIRRAQRANAMQ